MRDGGRRVSAARSHLRGKHRVPQLFYPLSVLLPFSLPTSTTLEECRRIGAILKSHLFMLCFIKYEKKLQRQNIQLYIIYEMCRNRMRGFRVNGYLRIFLSYAVTHLQERMIEAQLVQFGSWATFTLSWYTNNSCPSCWNLNAKSWRRNPI